MIAVLNSQSLGGELALEGFKRREMDSRQSHPSVAAADVFYLRYYLG